MASEGERCVHRKLAELERTYLSRSALPRKPSLSVDVRAGLGLATVHACIHLPLHVDRCTRRSLYTRPPFNTSSDMSVPDSRPPLWPHPSIPTAYCIARPSLHTVPYVVIHSLPCQESGAGEGWRERLALSRSARLRCALRSHAFFFRKPSLSVDVRAGLGLATVRVSIYLPLHVDRSAPPGQICLSLLIVIHPSMSLYGHRP